MPRVTYTPNNVTVEVEDGTSLLRAAMVADVQITAPCGGDGTCGKCRVIVENGSVEATTSAKLTQEQIATRVGKARVTITNALRMLTLPTEIRALISSSQLASGHAKALLGLDIEAEQLLIARRCVAEDMSVRSLEKLVAKLRKPKKKARATRTDIPKEHLNYIINKMHTHFGTSVRVSPTQTYANGKKKKGVIEIDFFSNEDLDRLLTMLDITID